ncbi:Peptidase family M23 [Pustulibacterium marinum]|uniref:Peptidase family M23 n=1 Tax=Pustulibacterium marinum TaxID=1224947 RepID=A0A1I7IVV4_9FLAO|nr:M23 family metallopeptidase [Pustulibacterium marinum]SFU77029.1 Peptidase family M23 [Pustulibacterium marinum]
MTKNQKIAAGTGAVLTAFVLYKYFVKKIKPIVKPLIKRGCDTNSMGCGNYGASRNHAGDHNGQDYVVTEGQPVYAPITGTITRKAYPYADDLQWQGFVIENLQYYFKVFYCIPVTGIVGTKVKAGDVVAYAQDISKKHGSAMTPHIHLEAYLKTPVGVELIDPNTLY